MLFLGIPALWVVNAAALFATAQISRRLLRPGALPYVVATFTLLLVGTMVLVFVATPAEYPDPICPANVPPWWPAWLPS